MTTEGVPATRLPMFRLLRGCAGPQDTAVLELFEQHMQLVLPRSPLQSRRVRSQRFVLALSLSLAMRPRSHCTCCEMPPRRAEHDVNACREDGHLQPGACRTAHKIVDAGGPADACPGKKAKRTHPPATVGRMGILQSSASRTLPAPLRTRGDQTPQHALMAW